MEPNFPVTPKLMIEILFTNDQDSCGRRALLRLVEYGTTVDRLFHLADDFQDSSAMV